jgi:predicted membrane protein
LSRLGSWRWAADFFAILATQGFGLAMGCVIYATFVGDQVIYYWAIPGIGVGVASVVLGGRLSKLAKPKSSIM